MKYRTFDSLSFQSAFALALLVSACSGDTTENPSGNGGTTGAGGTATANGGSSTSNGGSANGGSSSANGGSSTATGGSGTGGSPSTSGGATSGGSTAGGASSGGATASTGGAASGGSTSGGAASGGSSAGGAVNKGGATSGGTTAGGSAAGGAASGGAASGGAASGGAATGGSGTGGGTSTGGGVVGEPIGFATLNGGTTGGKGGAVVTATTYAQLKSYAESATAYVIMVQGTISNGANGGQINVKANKSIVGVGSTAFLNGVGINISNVNNVILQNLRVSLTGVTTRTDTAGVYSATGDNGLPQILVNGGDAISISGTSKNVWVDHCELFSLDPASQTNKDLFDGLIDIKGDTGFITVSWSYLHDHWKGGLVGAADEEVGANRKVTFHHNHYNKVKLRVPMYRGAVGHFFNNYIVAAQDASEIRAKTCIRIEKNYYEALHYSIYTTTETSISEGSAQRIDNIEVSRTSRAYPPSCTADIPYAYATALTNTTTDVKTVVPAGAGVGKI
ncbi:MAG: polysaccharide lyase family 1 protein [Polyangiaceae bacterium]